MACTYSSGVGRACDSIAAPGLCSELGPVYAQLQSLDTTAAIGRLGTDVLGAPLPPDFEERSADTAKRGIRIIRNLQLHVANPGLRVIRIGAPAGSLAREAGNELPRSVAVGVPVVVMKRGRLGVAARDPGDLALLGVAHPEARGVPVISPQLCIDIDAHDAESRR